jgi:hypothetical protein
MVKSPLWRKAGFSVYLSFHPMRETVGQHSSTLHDSRGDFSSCGFFSLPASPRCFHGSSRMYWLGKRVCEEKSPW